MRNTLVALAMIGVWVAGSGFSEALCNKPRILSTGYPRGSLSYIYTPGVEPGPKSERPGVLLKGRRGVWLFRLFRLLGSIGGSDRQRGAQSCWTRPFTSLFVTV